MNVKNSQGYINCTKCWRFSTVKLINRSLILEDCYPVPTVAMYLYQYQIRALPYIFGTGQGLPDIQITHCYGKFQGQTYNISNLRALRKWTTAAYFLWNAAVKGSLVLSVKWIRVEYSAVQCQVIWSTLHRSSTESKSLTEVDYSICQ